MKTKFLVAMLLASSVVVGCSKSADKPSDKQASLQDALSSSNKQAAANSVLPKADPATPLDQYVKLTSGNQLMFMYFGLSNMPVDYEEIAKHYSQDFERTSDAFKKQDILKALTPKIDSEIANAKQQRYFIVDTEVSLGSYDFNQKSFSVKNGLSPNAYFYFYNNSEYKYSFTNGDQFGALKVVDEALARQIESMLSKQRMKLVFYAFAQDADPSNHEIKSQIVKVKLLDGRGNELLNQ